MNSLNIDTELQSGKYRIIRVLGQGGFGITYLATSSQNNKQVAIKEFFPSGYCERNVMTGNVSLKSDVSKYKTKFISEAQKISQLHHKGVVKVIEVFEENGTAYYVMDYIKGKSLMDLILIKPFSVAESIDIIQNVAEALKHIHSKRMLHLDIKPMNIMIRDSDNSPIVIDFGISKTYDTEGNPNTTFLPAASQGYSSPEQLSGEINTFAPQLDIYSLGATFYSLLTGKLPSYPTPSTTSKLQFTPETPASIIAVVVKAMAYYQKDRYTTMTEFIKALPPKPAKNSTSAKQTGIKTSENAPVIRSFQIFNEGPYGVGQNITIKWSVKDEDELFLNGRKVDGVNKSKVIKYKTVGEKKLTLKAKNAYGEVSKTLTFYVKNLNSKPKATEETQIIADLVPEEDIIQENEKQTSLPKILYFRRKGISRIYPGDDVMVGWKVDNADTITVNGRSVDVNTSTTKVNFRLGGRKEISLIAANSNGSVRQVLEVFVDFEERKSTQEKLSTSYKKEVSPYNNPIEFGDFKYTFYENGSFRKETIRHSNSNYLIHCFLLTILYVILLFIYWMSVGRYFFSYNSIVKILLMGVACILGWLIFKIPVWIHIRTAKARISDYINTHPDDPRNPLLKSYFLDTDSNNDSL